MEVDDEKWGVEVTSQGYPPEFPRTVTRHADEKGGG